MNVEQMIKTAGNKMGSAYLAYMVWKQYELQRNANTENNDAQFNVDTLNKYSHIFRVSQIGALYVFVIDLCIFFDKQKPALSLLKIMDEVKLDEKQKQNIESRLKKQEKNIEFIKNLRDKRIAHHDLDIPDEQFSIIYRDTEELFGEIQEIFNIVTNAHDRSGWAWNLIDDEGLREEMQFMIKDLSEGNKIRTKF